MEKAININSKLSPHIIQVIFSKLSVVNLPHYRIVCKYWNDVIIDHSSTFKFVSNPNLIITKTISEDKIFIVDVDSKYASWMNSIASFKLDSSLRGTYIVNSCNGLLFLMYHDRRNYSCVLNVMTNEYLQIPFKESRFSGNFFHGFGFSLVTKQYKIVRVRSCTDYDDHVLYQRVEIFILGRDTEWRSLNSVPILIYLVEKCEGVYLNGALYWAGGYSNILYRFDVEDEKFDKISLPVDYKNKSTIDIQIFNGSLFVNLMGYMSEVEVWMMMQSHGKNEYSWIRKLVVKDIPNHWYPMTARLRRNRLRLVKIYENGQILCLFQGCHLFLCNPENGMIKPCLEEKVEYSLLYHMECPNFDSLKEM